MNGCAADSANPRENPSLPRSSFLSFFYFYIISKEKWGVGRGGGVGHTYEDGALALLYDGTQPESSSQDWMQPHNAAEDFIVQGNHFGYRIK